MPYWIPATRCLSSQLRSRKSILHDGCLPTSSEDPRKRAATAAAARQRAATAAAWRRALAPTLHAVHGDGRQAERCARPVGFRGSDCGCGRGRLPAERVADARALRQHDDDARQEADRAQHPARRLRDAQQRGARPAARLSRGARQREAGAGDADDGAAAGAVPAQSTPRRDVRDEVDHRRGAGPEDERRHEGEALPRAPAGGRPQGRRGGQARRRPQPRHGQPGRRPLPLASLVRQGGRRRGHGPEGVPAGRRALESALRGAAAPLTPGGTLAEPRASSPEARHISVPRAQSGGPGGGV